MQMITDRDLSLIFPGLTRSARGGAAVHIVAQQRAAEPDRAVHADLVRPPCARHQRPARPPAARTQAPQRFARERERWRVL